MSPLEPEDFLCLSDLGNAKRLVKKFGDQIKFLNEWKCWIHWDGKRWVRDDRGAVQRMARKVVAKLLEDAKQLPNVYLQEEQTKFAIKSQSARSLEAMVKLAKAEEGMTLLQESLDSDPWRLNVEDGVVDLESGERVPHGPECFMSKMAKVQFDPDGECPQWKAFLLQIFDNNQRLVDFIQRSVGYSLAGDPSEQVLYLLHGNGANGKSTFLNVLRHIFGDYASQAEFTTFTDKRSGQVRDDLAKLRGARLVLASEIDCGARLSESLVKQITGGDSLSVRELYGKYFEFTPQFTVWLAANTQPDIRGADYGIWRRIKMIPFNVTFSAEQQDRDLQSKLLAEGPGILNWMLEGCLSWQKVGLMPPPEVEAATEEYRVDVDRLAGFLEDCCVVHPSEKASAVIAYQHYQQWCKSNGAHTFSNKIFGQMLKERGFDKRRSEANGRTQWHGFTLKGMTSKASTEATEPQKPITNSNSKPTVEPTYSKNPSVLFSDPFEDEQDDDDLQPPAGYTEEVL